jgi:Na+-transporting NADH:ubiquinone oxidoreductase subunit C
VQRGNLYTIVFALLVAVIFSSLLAIASQLLRERQRLLEEADMKKNILQAVGLRECPHSADTAAREMSGKECNDIQCCYRREMKSFVIDYRGNVVGKGKVVPEEIDLESEEEKPIEERRYPVFARRSKDEIISYCIPVYGRGLWSSIYGYLALKPDLNTIEGVSFYKQGETPGLGAEIQSRWFQENFVGKRIFDAKGNLVSITVEKGKVNPTSPRAPYRVDGISGATLTGKGVTELLMKSLKIYEPYFRLLQRGVHRGSQ